MQFGRLTLCLRWLASSTSVAVSRRRPVRQPLILLCMFALLLAGCGGERYELHERKDGSLVRLDRRTGDLAVVSDTEIVRVKEMPELPPDTTFGKRRTWPTHTIPMEGDS